MSVIYARAAEDDDDDDALQRPALPVPDAPPTNEAVPPGDGLEYLRRVRAQASLLPDVVKSSASKRPDRAASTPTVSSVPHRSSMSAALAAVAAAPLLRPPPSSVLPRTAWQDQVLAEFAIVREELARHRGVARDGFAMPDAADARAWASWSLGSRWSDCSGQAASASSAGGGCPPTVRIVASLDQQRCAGLLAGLLLALDAEAASWRSHSTDGLNHSEEAVAASLASEALPLPPSEPLCRWLFATLARLARTLDGDTCATVRALFTTCSALRSEVGAVVGATLSAVPEATPGSAAAARVAEEARAEDARQQLLRWCGRANTLITLSGGFFGQAPRDEWRGRD